MKRFVQYLLFQALLIPALAAQKTSVKVYKKTFTTYPFSDPDPVPKPGRLAPYFRFDGFTDTPVEKEWTVVELENQWLRVMVMPEIGGKIWTAIEKSTGKPFIYYNHVVKFRDVAMRGPWTSGGIEANYGIIGHTPNCATPVNYTTLERPDGSASCVIGVLDLLTLTEWRLDINLPPDKAYFTTNSLWHNGSGMEQPYYSWMNTGIKAAGNLQFCYRGTHHLGHEGEVGDWPIDEQGRDISWYENNKFGGYKSYHVFGAHTNFFGGYWHDEGFGMGRYSTRDDKPGKKIWIWGHSRQGMIWEKLLTDTDGQYVEVQSGRLFTQSASGSVWSPFKYRSFAPYETDVWTEYWFPVLKTGGMVEANDYGVLNVANDTLKRKLTVSFCALQATTGDTLKVFEEGKLLFFKVLNLAPMQTAQFSEKYAGEETRFKVTVGNQKLTWFSEPARYELGRPTTAFNKFDWASPQGIYMQAKALSDQREYEKATALYDSCLARQPDFLPAILGLAWVKYHLAIFPEALFWVDKALKIDTYNAEANYLSGLVSLRYGSGLLSDAQDGFELAAQSTEFRAAALTELSMLYFKRGELEKARHYAEKCLIYNALNLTSLQMLALLERREGQATKAQKRLGDILQLDPLNHFARFEKYLLEKTPGNLEAFKSMFRGEMPVQEYLQLASFYKKLDASSELAEVLNLAPEHPEVEIWKAFSMPSERFTREEAMKVWGTIGKKLDALSPELVLPFRVESRMVDGFAQFMSKPWKAHFYAGIWHQFHHYPAEMTMAYFEACGDEPDYAPFYLTRAQLREKTRPEAALADLQRAEKVDSTQWRTGLYLFEFFERHQRPAEALAAAERFARRFPTSYILAMQHARALLLNKRPADCLAILEKTKVIPYEGATDGRGLYRNACLSLAWQALAENRPADCQKMVEKSRLWPENLGVGKPYDADIDTRVEDCIEALAAEKAGKKAEARSLFEKIAGAKSLVPSAELAAALALRKLGREAEGLRILQNAAEKWPANEVLKTAMAKFKDEPGQGLEAVFSTLFAK